MITNENAFYKNKLWCTYELKKESGSYDEELRLYMRKESQKNMFTCPDCDENLILCAGIVREPFFKHHKNSKCISRTITGSGNHLNIRRMLYHLAKRSFPYAIIDFNFNLNKNFIADIYIHNNTFKLVIEYLPQDMKLEKWEEKHKFYCDNNIIDVWILPFKNNVLDKFTTFEYLISKYLPIIKIIEYNNSNIWLKQKFNITADNSEKIITHSYSIEKLVLNINGEFECNYQENCINEVNKINNMIFAQLEKQKEESILIEKKLKQLNDEKDIRRQQKIVKLKDKNTNKKDCRNITIDDNSIKSKKVIRISMDNGLINKMTMKMPSIHELWELPQLVGKEWEIKKGGMARYTYLRKVNKKLEELTSDIEKEKLINNVIAYLNDNIRAYKWYVKKEVERINKLLLKNQSKKCYV